MTHRVNFYKMSFFTIPFSIEPVYYLDMSGQWPGVLGFALKTTSYWYAIHGKSHGTASHHAGNYQSFR